MTSHADATPAEAGGGPTQHETEFAGLPTNFSPTFSVCKCGFMLDDYRYSRGEQVCACPVDRAVSEFPLPEYVRVMVEPYIQWREDQAVAKFVLEQAEMAK